MFWQLGVGRGLCLARYDSVEAQARPGLHPGTLRQAGVGKGHLAVSAADGSEHHPTLGLATLAAALVQFGHLNIEL